MEILKKVAGGGRLKERLFGRRKPSPKEGVDYTVTRQYRDRDGTGYYVLAEFGDDEGWESCAFVPLMDSDVECEEVEELEECAKL